MITVRRLTLGFFLFAMGVAGVGFSVKLVEFSDDLTAEHGLQFAGAHLLTYGLIAAGFLMLLVLGFVRGHFKDIEEPKYDLLEKERRYDATSPRV
jgi:hypothetical protein